jgi:hypothetical protein
MMRFGLAHSKLHVVVARPNSQEKEKPTSEMQSDVFMTT